MDSPDVDLESARSAVIVARNVCVQHDGAAWTMAEFSDSLSRYGEAAHSQGVAKGEAEAPVVLDAASTEQMLAAALVVTYMAGEAGEDFRCWHEAHTEEWLENHAHALELLDYRWPRWEKSARKLLKLIGYSGVSRG